MKKTISIIMILLFALTSTILTGCGGAPTPSDEPPTPPETASPVDGLYYLQELCGYTEDEAFDKIISLSTIDEGYYTYTTDELFDMTGNIELTCDYGEVITAAWRTYFYGISGKSDGLEMYYDFIDEIEAEFPSAVGHDESYAEDCYTYVFNDTDINMSVSIFISDDETSLSVAFFE